jgi:hypothetical protein
MFQRRQYFHFSHHFISGFLAKEQQTNSKFNMAMQIHGKYHWKNDGEQENRKEIHRSKKVWKKYMQPEGG